MAHRRKNNVRSRRTSPRPLTLTPPIFSSTLPAPPQKAIFRDVNWFSSFFRRDLGRWKIVLRGGKKKKIGSRSVGILKASELCRAEKIVKRVKRARRWWECSSTYRSPKKLTEKEVNMYGNWKWRNSWEASGLWISWKHFWLEFGGNVWGRLNFVTTAVRNGFGKFDESRSEIRITGKFEALCGWFTVESFIRRDGCGFLGKFLPAVLSDRVYDTKVDIFPENSFADNRRKFSKNRGPAGILSQCIIRLVKTPPK